MSVDPLNRRWEVDSVAESKVDRIFWFYDQISNTGINNFVKVFCHGVVWDTVQQSGVYWNGKMFDLKPLLAC